jgi:hypothetical protein
MYKCAGDFSACDGLGAGWFKNNEKSMTAPLLTGISWGTAVVYATLKWTSTIPPTLAAGNNLIRHELLALHQANIPQFYAECAQLQITGGGKAIPSGSYLASIPTYASQNDRGIMVRFNRPRRLRTRHCLYLKIDIYSSTATNYTCPGPTVWKGQDDRMGILKDPRATGSQSDGRTYLPEK